jgi:hypothetical protein
LIRVVTTLELCSQERMARGSIASRLDLWSEPASLSA